eukprot:CAMPEP_0185728070 /NCGR_PEP_ID=MMETSP1171-20130828/3551_1 /TAXON_ID=374046 /ORGANISM="Helicotheca tamensis, Strain CCMP826" /LENGTH=647 /DNA_ID=CAMNT_0028396735 /DNA_START=130 /DNA_END=2073 /DNA_ORIENTATION=+
MSESEHPRFLKFTRVQGNELAAKNTSLGAAFEVIGTIVSSVITLFDILTDYNFIYQVFSNEKYTENNPYLRSVILILSILIVVLGGRLYFLIHLLHSFEMDSTITLKSGLSMWIPGIFTYKTFHSNDRMTVELMKEKRKDRMFMKPEKGARTLIFPPPLCLTTDSETHPKRWATIVFLYYELFYGCLSVLWLPFRVLWLLVTNSVTKSAGESTYFSILESIVESFPQTVITSVYTVSQQEGGGISLSIWISLGLSAFSTIKSFINYLLVRSKMHGLNLGKHHTGPVLEFISMGDGSRFVSGSYDHTLRIWELKRPLGCPVSLETQKVIKTTHQVKFVSHLTSNMIVVGGLGGVIEIWDIQRDLLVKHIDSGHKSLSAFASMKTSESTFTIAAVGNSGEENAKIKLFDFIIRNEEGKKNEEVQLIPRAHSLTLLPFKSCFSCQWLVNRREVVLLHGGKPEIWLTKNVLKESGITSSGQLEVICEEDNTNCPNFEESRITMLCEDNTNCPNGATGHVMRPFSNEDKISTSHSDGVRLWKLGGTSRDSQLLWFHHIPKMNLGLAVSLDCRYIAAGDEEGSLRVWFVDPLHPDDEKLITEPALSASGTIRCVCFSDTYEFKEIFCSGHAMVTDVFAQNREESSVPEIECIR